MSEPLVSVIVTTERRGVFYGKIAQNIVDQGIPETGRLTLRDCRNIIYWPAETGGFLGNASIGPQAGARIGERVDLTHIESITSITPCTAEAEAIFEGITGRGTVEL